MTTRHTLYRFYDRSDSLLYIGISMTPWERFRQHRHDKPWWDDIVTIRKEEHPTRQAVLEAEKAAIIAEKPQHNIVHNRGRSAATITPTTGYDPLEPGRAVALCMANGECHVGMIDGTDGYWLTLIHKCWITGGYWGTTRTIKVADIVEVVHCDFVDNEWQDDQFAGIQTRWNETRRPVRA